MAMAWRQYQNGGAEKENESVASEMKSRRHRSEENGENNGMAGRRNMAKAATGEISENNE
jgi:hypothetical protein